MSSSIIIFSLLIPAVFTRYINNKLIKILTYLSSFLVIISTIPMFGYKNIIANISYIIFMIATILAIRENCITTMLKNKNEKYKAFKIFLIISGFTTLAYTLIISIIDFDDIYTRYLTLIGAFMLFTSKNIILNKDLNNNSNKNIT
ncbi:MAG: hypothetical protein ACLUCH_07835 [Lachnospirales bacterium]